MRIGFTGTQRGMTKSQLERVKLVLTVHHLLGNELHHGDCIGADAQAAQLAGDLGYRLMMHPPTNNYKRAHTAAHHVFPAMPYLVRNHDIVNACELLIACPGERTEQLRSGTWATVRYARNKKVPVELILP